MQLYFCVNGAKLKQRFRNSLFLPTAYDIWWYNILIGILLCTFLKTNESLVYRIHLIPR